MQFGDDMQLVPFRRQRGMTLTEVILAMTVAVLMMVMMARMQAAASADLRAKNTAESLQSFTQLAGQYFLAHSATMMQIMKDGKRADGSDDDCGTAGSIENFCCINTNTSTGIGTKAINIGKHTCAVDGSYLKYQKVLPSGFSETNAYNQKWTAIFKLVYDTTTNLPTGDVELLVVGATNGGAESSAPSAEIGLTAELMGANGGFVPEKNIGACTTTNACGTGGGWKANLSDFLPTPPL